MNPFIKPTTLQPSRYALAYTPATNLSVYVDLSFIALDAENLCEFATDEFHYDFGDNKFPYFKGKANAINMQHDDDDDDNDNETVTGDITTFENLRTYMP